MEKIREIGLFSCICIAMGIIVGAGIFGALPVAVDMTGKGIVLAFILSTITIILRYYPTIITGASIPASFGYYMHATRLAGPNLGFTQVIATFGNIFVQAILATVFAMYFLYGLVFIRFFQVIEALGQARSYLFMGLAIAAIVFGVFNIRDFVRYKPGGIGTEMPLLMRPRVKKILSKITSTKGAALAGVLVTVFLLPCTIGPYIIAAGILSVFDMVSTAPILLLYNLVFILPFLGIIGGVYLGMRRVHDIYLWKEKNISKLHLVAGCIILGLGIFLLLESLGIA